MCHKEQRSLQLIVLSNDYSINIVTLLRSLPPNSQLPLLLKRTYIKLSVKVIEQFVEPNVQLEETPTDDFNFKFSQRCTLPARQLRRDATHASVMGGAHLMVGYASAQRRAAIVQPKFMCLHFNCHKFFARNAGGVDIASCSWHMLYWIECLGLVSRLELKERSGYTTR